jgi:single-strand DNA-binding protein
MANFNKVILIGRLTRDPEVRTFSNGGKVAKFGFAASNRKKNAQSGQWEEVPMFIDIDAFNRGDFGTLANVVEQYCRKGSQICVEGHLVLDTWDDKTTGQKRSKHMIVADSIQLLDTRSQGEGAGGARSTPAARAPVNSDAGSYSAHEEMGESEPPSSGGTGDDIPF